MESDLHKLAVQLVEENKRLRDAVAFQEEAIDELVSQREQLNTMLILAQMKLAEIGTIKNSTSESGPQTAGLNNEWLPACWLSTTKIRQHLGTMELLWMNKQPDDALEVLDKYLTSDIGDLDMRVEGKLLKSAILRDTGKPAKALKQAEEALATLKRNPRLEVLYHLRGKVHFHRGLSLYGCRRFKEALWCFTFAIATQDHETVVEEWKMKAEGALAQ